jgi:hypothetical protein
MSSIRLNEELPHRLRLIGVAIAAWSGVAGIFLVQRLFASAVKGVGPAWDRLALEMTVTWGGWALLTPLILLAVRRLPLPSDNPWRTGLHVPIGVGVGLAHSLIVATITPLFIWRPSLLPIRDMFAGRVTSTIAFETLIYFMVAAVLYAWIYATERQRLTLRLNAIRGPAAAPESLAIPARDGLLRVPVESIDWIKAEDNYVRLYVGGQSHLIRTTLKALEDKLPPTDFVRIHRSAMVSVSKIAKLQRTAPDRHAVILANGARLRVSRAYRKQLVAAMESPLTPR